MKPPAEALWPDAPLPVARHVLAQAVDCRLPASPDTERVGSLFRQVAQRAAAAGAGIDRGGWRRVPCALDVIAGALPSSLLQIALKNGHTFRPTLVGRMDSAPEKVRLVSAFLGALCDAHAGRTCIVGSSTTAARSPDWIMNTVAGSRGVPILRISNRAYTVADDGRIVDGAAPSNLEDHAVRAAFAAGQHFVFGTPEEYADALATVSNVAIITGGRADSLREFKQAVMRGHPVLFVDTPAHVDTGVLWDADRTVDGKPAPRPDNAIAYVRHQLACIDAGRAEDRLPDFSGITARWFAENRATAGRLIFNVQLHDDASIAAAVAAAAAHLRAASAAA